MEQKVTTSVMKGVILALVLIALSLVFYFTDLYKQKWTGWLQYAIFGGGIIWACINYAQQKEGNVTFGNTFAHGFKTSAATTSIIIIYTFVSFKFIMPEVIDYALEEARKGMVEKQNLTTEQMEQALSMTKKFFVPFAIGAVIIAYLFFGAIFSLIGAAIAKKNPNYNPLLQE